MSGRLLAVAATALLAGAACGGGRAHSNAQIERVSNLAGVRGTMLARLHEAFPSNGHGRGLTAIFTARSKTANATPVGPANRFASSTRAVTVLAHVGALAGRSPLKLHWYAVDNTGHEALLTTRTIAVAPDTWAWSVGSAPGPVRPGLYEVVARLAGGELATWFRVGQPPPSRAQLASASSGKPSDFNSWSDGAKSAAGSKRPACEPYTSGQAFSLTVDGFVNSSGACSKHRVTIAAAVTGEPVEKGSGIGDAGMSVDPCELPGGTDEAGTVVHLLGRDTKTGKSSTREVTLTEFPFPPFVGAVTDAPDGSKVHPGQRLAIRFGAVELPFEKGIKKIEVVQDGKDVFRWINPSDTPKACDKERFIVAFKGTLTIEQDPPKIVEVVVRAEDYDGRFGWAFLHYPTQGATWTGKATVSLDQRVPAGNQSSDADLQAALTEDPNGKVEGVLNGQQIQTLDLSNCPSATHSPGHIRAEVSGTFKDDVLSLELGAVSFTKPGVTPCPWGPPEVMGSLVDPLFPPVGKALSSITKQADGKYHGEARGTYGQMYPYTVDFTIDLKRSA